MFDYIRPLLFREESLDHLCPNAHSSGGTCFLFLYGGKPYIVSAKHCLKNRDIASLTVISNLWVQNDEMYHQFSFTSPFQVLPHDEDDCLDVIFYPVDTRDYTPNMAKFFLPYQQVSDDDFSLKSRSIYVAGYPDPVHETDYDKGFWEGSGIGILVKNIEKDDIDSSMYKIHLADNLLESYNGFSGSPVYCVDCNKAIKIIGMVLTGHPENKILRFLDIRFICRGIHGNGSRIENAT